MRKKNVIQAFTIVLFCFSAIVSQAQTNQPDTTKKTQIVEASCGQCQFGLSGKSCNLAVRINGVAYFVDGSHIDAHGDAHAQDGFCNAIRKAEVRGAIVNNRFKATYFKLLKPEEKDQPSKQL